MLLLFILLLPSAIGLAQQQCPMTYRYYHFVVLVHGYMGSDREQEYLGEVLLQKSRKIFNGDDDDATDETSFKMSSASSLSSPPTSSMCDDNSNSNSQHQLLILNSKANVKVSTDGIANGGKRLAEEIKEWIEKETAKVDPVSSKTVFTFSLVGNSLGGLYGRYALAELDFLRKDNDGDGNKNSILPLVFCTTSSPHIGVSQETFIQLPPWVEPYVATAFRQQTMNDLFGVNDSTIVRDMCQHVSNETTKGNGNIEF